MLDERPAETALDRELRDPAKASQQIDAFISKRDDQRLKGERERRERRRAREAAERRLEELREAWRRRHADGEEGRKGRSERERRASALNRKPSSVTPPDAGKARPPVETGTFQQGPSQSVGICFGPLPHCPL